MLQLNQTQIVIGAAWARGLSPGRKNDLLRIVACQYQLATDCSASFLRKGRGLLDPSKVGRRITIMHRTLWMLREEGQVHIRVGLKQLVSARLEPLG